MTTFKTGKEHHLHSLSLGADGENFLSADANRVNLWNLERQGADVYNLVDYNRQKFGDHDEIVTSARFSQESPMFLYSTNTGKVNICDLRESSDFHERPSVQFTPKARRVPTIFDRFLNVVSQAQFVPNNPNVVVSRDYLSVKLWDLRMGGDSRMIVDSGNDIKPTFSAQVTDYTE